MLGAGVDGAALPAGPPRGDVSQAADEEGAAGVACGIGDGARASVATRGGSVAMAGLAARKSMLLVQRFNNDVARDEPTTTEASGAAGRAQSVRRLPSLSAVVTASAAAACAGLIVEGMIDFPIRNPLSRTTVFLMIGWALAGQRLMRTERAAAEKSRLSHPKPGGSADSASPAGSGAHSASS